MPAVLAIADTGDTGPAEADVDAIEGEIPSLESAQVALGSRFAGLREFARLNNLKHLLDLGQDEWKEKFLEHVEDSSTTFHVSSEGFFGNNLQEMVINEMRSGSNTGWELQQLQQAGRLPSLNFYQGAGKGVLMSNPFLQ